MPANSNSEENIEKPIGSKTESDYVDLALSYFAKGWNVIPIKSDKRPLVGSWKQWKDRKQGINDIINLDWKNASGVAGICGATGYEALDIDKECKNLFLQIEEDFPSTRRAKTQHDGNHFIYKVKNHSPSTDKWRRQFGFELQGIGNYIILAGSFDGAYEVLNPEMPIAEIDNLYGLCKEIVKRHGWKEPKATEGVDIRNIEVENIFDIPCVCFFKDNPFPEGARHNAMGKNLCILLTQIYGNNGEELVGKAEELVKNQQDFSHKEILYWKNWTKNKKFSCGEVIKYIKNYYPDFKCGECKIRKLQKEEEEEPPSFPEEVVQKAKEIIEQGKPMDFIAEQSGFLHLEDEELRKFLWCSGLSADFDYKLHTGGIGSSGVGKDDLFRSVAAVIPAYYLRKVNISSPRAPYYAGSAKKIGPGCIIYYEDVDLNKQMLKILKDLATDTLSEAKEWTITDKLHFAEKILPRTYTVWFTSIRPLRGDEGQILRRYCFINPTEEIEDHKKIQEFIKKHGRRGDITRPKELNEELAQCVTWLIKSQEFKVVIPFSFNFPYTDLASHTSLKQFITLVKVIAKTNYPNRIRYNDLLLTEPSDFEIAKELWGSTEQLKLTKHEKKIYDALPSEEPYEELVDEGGPKSYYTNGKCPEDIAKEVNLATSTVRNALGSLASEGIVERKKIRAKNNAYCYWKSSVTTLLPVTISKIVTTFEDSKEGNQKNDGVTTFLRNLGINDENLIKAYLERISTNKNGSIVKKPKNVVTDSDLTSSTGVEKANGVTKTEIVTHSKIVTPTSEERPAHGKGGCCGEEKDIWLDKIGRWICWECIVKDVYGYIKKPGYLVEKAEIEKDLGRKYPFLLIDKALAFLKETNQIMEMEKSRYMPTFKPDRQEEG